MPSLFSLVSYCAAVRIGQIMYITTPLDGFPTSITRHTKRVPIPNDTSSGSSRRDVSIADLFGTDTTVKTAVEIIDHGKSAQGGLVLYTPSYTVEGKSFEYKLVIAASVAWSIRGCWGKGEWGPEWQRKNARHTRSVRLLVLLQAHPIDQNAFLVIFVAIP